jgi:alpha-tubulin suppressor-like RCC1 family protein
LLALLLLAPVVRAQDPAHPAKGAGGDITSPGATLPWAAAASWGTVVVNVDGSVTAWPEGTDGQALRIALPRKAVGAAVHQYTAFFLLDDGTVMGVGKNNYQSLGRDGDGTSTPSPIPGLRDIVQIAATYGHALALRNDGAVFAWGEDVDGLRGTQQGIQAQPARVPGLPAITQVATAARHSLALGRDGRVYAWGQNGRGELGNGSAGPPAAAAAVPELDDVIAVAAGLQTSLALKRDGSVWAWGSNQSAMLGSGQRGESSADGNRLTPAPVKGIANGRAIAAGEGFVLVLLADGTLRAWGFDGYGQIGVGTSGGYHLAPQRIPSLTKVSSISAGGYRAFATTADGRLWHWGTPIPVTPGRRPNVKVPAVLETTVR